MQGWPTGVFYKHVDSDCYVHRSPAFVSSTLFHSSLEAMAFPFVFCRPHTVSTDLWKTDRQTDREGGRGGDSESHFSAVKSDSCLEPVFTDSILCPEAAVISVTSIIVPSFYHHGRKLPPCPKGIPQGVSRWLL